MDQSIEAQLHGAIFHDPGFIDRFLAGDTTKLDKVHRQCGLLDDHYGEETQWRLPLDISTEKSLYASVLHILNTIKKAVHIVHATPSEDQQSTTSNHKTPSHDFVSKEAHFINTSTYAISSDRAETAQIKPDLVLFEDVEESHRHWEHVRIPVEIKKLTSYHKAGMKQLSRYAWAVFAHQLHRRHLYAMMVCGTEWTFVRFDRGGILYSRCIDLRTDSKAFTCAFASLLMLDRTDQGYDPAFTCSVNDDGRLDYFVNLPVSPFATNTLNDESALNEDISTLRFLVVDRWCHKEDIRGRATMVLRIHRVGKGGDENKGDEYVLKIMSRDPERGLEGEALQKGKGNFGVAQHVWHADASGSCRCSPKSGGPWKCHKCVAETVQIDGMEVCDALVDLAIQVPPEEEEEDPELRAVDTSICHATSQKRLHLICTYVVVSTMGVPLKRAESPRQFVQAALDAILGYWGLYNIGIMHRDISEGNVMILSPDQQLAYQLDDKDSQTTCPQIKDRVLVESEKKLREVVEKLGGRKPTGMLTDFDLHAYHPPNVSPEKSADSVDSNHTAAESIQSATGLADSSQPDTTAISAQTRGHRPREDDTTADPPAAKKRRIGRLRHRTNVTKKSLKTDDGAPLVDHRIGTPAFMSIRVLSIEPGEQYEHSFMDDLESFFWLVLWCATAHTDPGYPINYHAQSLLKNLNQSNLRWIKGEKVGTVLSCCMHDGECMLRLLEQIGNDWATHPIIVDVIIDFGVLVYKYIESRHVNHSPVDVFPAVVGIFQNALDSNDD